MLPSTILPKKKAIEFYRILGYNTFKEYKEDVAMRIHESGENYLEAIYVLNKQNGQCRSIDIARHMNFSKPTISIAMRSFREEGYIVIDEGGYITLTEKGLAVANRVYERHQLLMSALIALGVSEETAEADACKIEHDISDETLNCIRKHMEAMQKKPTQQKKLSIELL